MDYKYIEQLLARYWECETTPQEESILKAFFAQENVPEHLARYKDLFVYEQKQTQIHLDERFDERVLAAIDKDYKQIGTAAANKVVKVQHITLARRLRPLYRAAASVAIITLLGTATQHWFTKGADNNAAGWDYNQSAYKDSYQDPQKAYEASVKTLEMFKEGAQTAINDSASHADGHKMPAKK